ncbi:MAG: sulfatase [Planctomycetota bacterium]
MRQTNQVYGSTLLRALIACLGLGLIAAVGLSLLLRPEQRKNVLLIVVDTLRADHLGCYGYPRPTTPHIDALAETGTLFSRFYTVVPSTLASFTSFLTSLHPKDHGTSRNGFTVNRSAPIVSEVFQNSGYETSAFVSSFCLSSEFGMDRGFDYFNEEFNKGTSLADNKLIRSARFVTASFLIWLNQRNMEKPFFSMVHYFDPHWPYSPTQATMKLFNAHESEPGTEPSFIQAQENLSASNGIPGEFEKNMHNLYCAEIRCVDTQIGKILDHLKQMELLEDTIVVFTADHGETFWEHDDFFNHGLFVYDTTLHIPLIISNPGWVPDRARSDVLLSSLDLAPTLCDLTGIEVPAEFQGESFMELLLHGQAPKPAEPLFFAEATRPPSVEEGAARPNLNKAKCVRKGPFKFISVPYTHIPRRELYNLDTDPEERQNLIDDSGYTDLATEMEEALRRWANHYRSSDRSENRDAMDSEARNKLNQLGY